MSLNAVQSYVVTLLDGLVSSNLPPAVAWVQPPILDDLAEAPRIYLWGGHLDEERYTLPRVLAHKIVRHRLDIYVLLMTQNDPAGSRAFVVLLDAIRKTLRSTAMPVGLTDEESGETSVLQTIGEFITQDYTTPVAVEDQRSLEHSAYLVASVTEILDA